MLKNSLQFILTMALLLLPCLSFSTSANDTIVINHRDVLKTQTSAPIGENMNFLLSSDKHMPRSVSMKARAKEMKLSILRFPYGHLADNYLFTDAPFDDGINGLTPRVASIKQTPGDYDWAVDDDGYFKQALDFDEYMSYINQLNVEPLIVINMLSYDKNQYPETVVTFDDLKTHAEQWLKYANITRGYKVKYWQLGNEVAAHTDKDSYFKHFVEMARAMKAIDPSIHIGFGEDGRRNWLKHALADPEISKYIDFISPHQYLHGKHWSESYQHWRDYAGTLTPKIDKFQRYALQSENHKNVPIIVTEYGATGGRYPERDPKGTVVFKSLSEDLRVAGYLQPTSNGKHLTKLEHALKANKKNQAIAIELFADAWIGLKLNDKANSYIKAQSLASSPLTTDGSVDDDGAKWRLLEVKKQQFYLGSKLHPKHYMTYNAASRLFALAAKVATAEKFKLEPYTGSKKFQPEASFTHNSIPEPEPKPLTRQPLGNFANDLWKSLVFADMTLSALRHKNISHMIHWNTHTSWQGKFGGYHNLANSLENNDDNSLTPIGQVLKLINSHVLEQILNIKTKHGFIRAFASFDPQTGAMSIILLNKNDSEEMVNLDLGSYQPTTEIQLWRYTGADPEDEYPTTEQVDSRTNGLITIKQGIINTKLPATSLTVIRLTDDNH